MPALFLWLDPYLIRLYRLTGYAYFDFFLGTLVLAFLALIIGEASASLASRAVRQQADRGADETRVQSQRGEDSRKSNVGAGSSAAPAYRGSAPAGRTSTGGRQGFSR